MDALARLLQTHKTVFTFQEIKQILGIPTNAGVKSFLQRAKKDQRLLHAQKGVRTLPVYNQFELAGKLFPGGYISLERVLFDAGVSFQRYGSTVHCIRHKAADIYVNNENYITQSIKLELYTNSLFIQEVDGYRKAMPERALCDLVYLRPNAHFDNPQYFQNQYSKYRLEKLLPLYPKTTQKHVMKLVSQQL